MKQQAEHIRQRVSNAPNKPGIYQFFDENGKLIYVGKAKNLKKRVASYFSKQRFESGKTAMLVRKTADVKFILVDTELEALLLENSLIKEYQPRYNIQWRDDKSYPWIRITNERFPRIFSTRNVVKDGSHYFGPYASVKMMKTLLDLAQQLYPLRTCNYDLSEENIRKKKFKVCLEYHIGNCLGPCEGLQEEAEYEEHIAHIKKIIKGYTREVIRHLKSMMKNFADQLDFEKAQMIKENIALLENYQSKSTVVSPTIKNAEVLSLASNEKYASVNYMRVMNGAIVQGHTMELKKKLDEPDRELLETALVEFRQRFESDAREVIVPFEPEISLEDVTFHVPQRGDKKKLLELSERNAKFHLLEQKKLRFERKGQQKSQRVLEQLKKDLKLTKLPVHIECFDNSNIQGTHPVAACVVFKDAKPAKKEYRHFNIRTVKGPDDFASMEEVIYRRYKRLKEEDLPLPQLIVIDGGKGQLSSALKSLEKLDLRGKISIVGIAKKLEEIYFPNDPVPLYLDKRSESLKLIQHLRNEAHRFGIQHHRGRRSKASLGSELADIEGVGEKSAEQLLRHFKSVSRVKASSLEELEEVLGSTKRAKIVYTYYHDS